MLQLLRQFDLINLWKNLVFYKFNFSMTFFAENLQTHEEGSDLSWMSYDNEQKNASLPALMHNLGIMEYQNLWGRCWVDFGTSDSISIDILINSLNEISNNYVKIEELIIGGENNDWAIEEHEDLVFKD